MMADELQDRFREEAKEVAQAAHGAARDDKDMRSDRITAKLLDMVDRLQRDVMENMQKERAAVEELKTDMARIEAKVDSFMQAFPAGDAIQHRLAHEAQINDSKKREDFLEKMKFTIAALLLSAGVVWVGIVLWKAFLLGPH